MASGIPVDPKSNPKGVKKLCELCQKPAFIQCAHCRVTFYCDAAHQNIDWLGIHEKICQLLIPLRTPMPFFHSESERLHRKQQLLQRQKHLIKLTSTMSQTLLFEAKYEEAIPAAMQCLRFTADLHGLSSIQLVHSYLMLAEASIGLNKLKQAEEYIAQADWTVMQTPDCPNTIKHQLSRKSGLLYTAKGELQRALFDLSNDIYSASEEYGPHAIQTSGGYFHMANVFHHQGKLPIALSLYDQVTDIWYDCLSGLVKIKLESPKVVSALTDLSLESKLINKGDLDEAQQAEALVVLNAIFNVRESVSEKNSVGVAKIAYTLAMLYYLLDNTIKAKEMGRRAVSASAGLHDEDFSRSVVHFLKICENVTDIDSK